LLGVRRTARPTNEGAKVVKDPVTVPDYFATVGDGTRMDPRHEA